MPQQHDTATVQVPSDVHDAFLEGCGGDHQAAESLLRKTLMAPSVAEAVNAAHQHVASNPSDDHFDAAKEGLSRAFCEFFERANQAEAMQMASLHMLALYTLRRDWSELDDTSAPVRVAISRVDPTARRLPTAHLHHATQRVEKPKVSKLPARHTL